MSKITDNYEQARNESQRILDKLQIKRPSCGFDVGLGWMPIIEKALDEMVAAGWNKELDQIKQKFCGLRIYVRESTPEVIAIIAKAERECELACENCGAPHGLPNPGCRGGVAFCPSCIELAKQDGWWRG